MKLTQEELDILENAPKGATHWMTHIIQDSEYAAFIEAEDCYRLKPFDEDFYICDGTWVDTPLEDLRKRKEQEDNQQKIVDAVNYLNADLLSTWGSNASSDTHLLLCLDGDYLTDSMADQDCSLIACTIEEFNQCVKEMSKHTVPADVFRNYLENKTPLEPKQKIVDAVNLLKADLNNCWGVVKGVDYDLVFESGDYLTVNWGSNNKVCTIEEFNQCVKEMSEHKGHNEFTRYQEWLSYSKQNGTPTKLEPKQKPVEWVNGDKCVYLNQADKPATFIGMRAASKTHCIIETQSKTYMPVNINELSKPVTKEKRYVSFDKHGKFINETNGDGACDHWLASICRRS